ncbi:hypothetical protein HYU20_03090 [Candidatus Woesearchaeota archaeon]|nr:hypothetical protein [Candidatus Woesearchaeota archaeon]
MKNVFKAALFMIVLVLSAAFVSAGADPVLTDPGAKSVNEGSLLSISLTATAPDLGGYTNFTACLLPSAAGTCTGSKVPFAVGTTIANITNLSNTAGQFNWTPDFTQSGTYFFNFSTSDADPTISTKVVTVTVVDVPPKLTATATLTFGGENQERSNPRHDTIERKEINVIGTITLKNDGPETLSNLKGAVSAATGFTSDNTSTASNNLNITFSLTKASLAPGESVLVPVSIRVPQTLGTVSGTTQLDVRAENNLRLKDVKIRFDGKSENVDDGDTVKDMKPGMTVVFEIEVENRFKDKEDVTIEDIEVKAISNGELDIDEDDDIGDLGPEDTDTVRFESVIDEDADDGTFSVEISAEGLDEFGARHGEKISVDFEIKRKSHEIEVKSLVLNPPTVSCEKEASLTASIRNSGRRDEEEVYVNVASPELKFGARSDKLELDQDDESTVSFNIPVPEDAARPANYRITVDTYFNTGTKSNSDVAILALAQCKAAEAEEEPSAEEKQPVTVVTTPPAAEQPKQPVAPAQPEKKPFTETPQYLALLALGYVAVLGGGGLLLFKLLQKP